MEFNDDLLDYIQEVPEENYIELSEFILYPSSFDCSHEYQTDNNNNNNNVLERHDNDNEVMPVTSKKIIPGHSEQVTHKNHEIGRIVKVKRGRPPSNPPSREVVKKRRKVKT